MNKYKEGLIIIWTSPMFITLLFVIVYYFAEGK